MVRGLKLRYTLSLISIGMLAAAASPVFAQSYPSKPMRIVTGGAGGGNDIAARFIAVCANGSDGRCRLPCGRDATWPSKKLKLMQQRSICDYETG